MLNKIMASYLCKLSVIPREISALRCVSCQHLQSRFIRQRGKSYEEAKSFEDRMNEIKAESEKNIIRNNIGFPFKKQKIASKKKDYVELEELARLGKLQLDLEEVRDKWLIENGRQCTHTIVEHYGIYRDLFNNCYFYPQFFMDIKYDVNDQRFMPIYMGNVVTPTEVSEEPQITYDCKPDSLYTLVLTSPDGNLQDNNSEFLHWMVGNIPGNQVQQGEVICDYMPPFPPQGVGFARYVFVLYEQNQRMDYSKLQRPKNCLSLAERNFQTFDFYGERQDDLTPASIAFYQSQWHPSVTKYFRETLKMKEPIFEFIQPPSFHPLQQKYPHKQPFHKYLDRYRDVKDIQEEVLKYKLSKINPFERTKQPKYPLLFLDRYKPTWLRLKEKQQSLRRHQWRDT